MFKRIFLDHPRSVNEGYFQHFFFALRFSAELLCAGLAALVHAFIPALFEKTASNLINRMHQRMHKRFES